MSILSELRDKYIVTPVVDRIAKAVTPDSVPSVMQVPTGFNSSNADYNKRASAGVGFGVLRAISTSHETTRAAINARKRQITGLDWDIVDIDPDNGEATTQERQSAREIIQHLAGPGARFRELLDKGIEDLLVLDAMCWYKQRTNGGKLLRLIPIDGSTIKLRVDDSGAKPQPPEIAYEQWLRGQKVADMTTDDLLYEKMNPRTNSPYGLSPIESLILIVDSALKAGNYNANWLDFNNIPAGFLSMPAEWTVDQIKEYKEFFDSMVSSSKDTAKVFPIPAGASYQATMKPNDFAFKDFFDYLDRKVVMLFDIAPQELGLTLQQYKENAQGQEIIQQRKGIKPLANFFEEIFTELLREEYGFSDLAFRFLGLDERFTGADAKDLLEHGVINIDEIRNDLGLKKLGIPNAFMLPGTPTLVSALTAPTVSGTNQGSNQPEAPIADVPEVDAPKDPNPKPSNPQPADLNITIQAKADLGAELKTYERKALAEFKKKGRITKSFKSEVIPEISLDIIEEKLSNASDKEEIKKIFRIERLIKSRKNLSFEAVEDKSTFKNFRSAIKAGLMKQIQPFTDPDNIQGVTEAKKDELSDLLHGVGNLVESISIEGLEGYLKWSAEQGGQIAYQKLNVDGSFTLTNDHFQEMLGDRSNYLITSVDDTTKSWIAEFIAGGKDAGETNSEIAKRISDSFDEVTDSRAEMIVNTEVANAMQTAEVDTYSQQGIEKYMWVTSEDDLVDEECAALDGEVIKVGDTFSSGDDSPPLHPRCRCFIQAVLE